jgi:hypothetical protein
VTTDAEEIRYSTMTRVAGQTENYALDVEPECGLNRAAVSSVERGNMFVVGPVSVSATAVALKVGASNSPNQRAIAIQNQGPLSIWIGHTSGVTVATGYEVALKEKLVLKLSENQTIWAISASGTQSVRLLEVS